MRGQLNATETGAPGDLRKQEIVFFTRFPRLTVYINNGSS